MYVKQWFFFRNTKRERRAFSILKAYAGAAGRRAKGCRLWGLEFGDSRWVREGVSAGLLRRIRMVV
jgi:hypothetical protein